MPIAPATANELLKPGKLFKLNTQPTGATGEDLARATRRRAFVAWLVASLLVVVALAGYFAYKPWRLQSLQQASRAAMTAGDYSEASLIARRALQLDPNFAPACITMAEIGEHDRVSDAIAWRERVLHLRGESPDTLIALASTALSFGRVSSARSALEKVPENARQREDFLVIAGTLALEARNEAEAARFFENAIRINPEKASYRLALGKAQAASNDYLIRQAGLRELSKLGTDEQLGVSALRALITNLEAHKENLAALRHAQQLVALPSHDFFDEMLRLRLMKSADDRKFTSALAETQQKAESDPNKAGALLLWMNHAGLASDGLEWVKGATKIGRAAELRPAIAACYLTLNDWNTLLAMTQAGAWKPVEYVRHAYRARAFRALSENEFARSEWNLAINTAVRQAEALSWLAQMASEWKWRDEAEQSLWAVLDIQPTSRPALESLQKQYLEKGNTSGLRRVAVHLAKTDPADENALNDLALSSLLLNTEPDRAMKIAKDLYTKHPDNIAYASTFAFALHCAARTAEGLKVLESMPSERLEEPSVAAYYGVMLAANHSIEKASHFLELGRGASLLPEELELVKRAERAIDESRK